MTSKFNGGTEPDQSSGVSANDRGAAGVVPASNADIVIIATMLKFFKLRE